MTDLHGYLTRRVDRERGLADEAAAMFELTGDDVWLSLRQLHIDDLRDLTDELARVGNGA